MRYNPNDKFTTPDWLIGFLADKHIEFGVPLSYFRYQQTIVITSAVRPDLCRVIDADTKEYHVLSSDKTSNLPKFLREIITRNFVYDEMQEYPFSP